MTFEETVAIWQQQVKDEDSKSRDELFHQTCKALAKLDEIETRLSEHLAIEAHIARHGTPDNRRRHLLLHRSEIRQNASSLMQSLKRLGMTEDEMYEQLPFVGKCDIQQLINNEP